MSMTKHLIFALTALFMSAGAAVAQPMPMAAQQQIREAFAEEVGTTITENMPYRVYTEGPDATRLVVMADKGPGNTPRAPSAMEMHAKTIGFHDIVYRTPDGNVTVKLKP